MKNLHHCFDHLPDLPDEIVQEGLNGQYEVIEVPNVIRCIPKAFHDTDFYKNFVSNLGRTNAVYLKNYSHSAYNWHRDMNRQCAVNWVIKTSPGAATYFAQPYDDDKLNYNRVRDNKQILFLQLEEVKYKILKPVIINTAYNHSVFNNSPEERIILSLVPFEASFDEVKNYLENLSISKY